jgi:alanine racemase
MDLNASLVWAEIDLNAIAHNIRELRRMTHPNAKLMGVVKANGYGHGAVQVAQCALQNGAELLGVARIEEGIQVRETGIEAPILIFGYTPPEMAPTLFASDLTPTVYTLAAAKALSEKAASLGKKIKIHLKVDTGMGRLGLVAHDLSPKQTGSRAGADPVQEALSIASLASLEVEGIFTHFATADSADKSYADKQLDLFMDFLNRLRKAGLDPGVKHAANSAALIDMPQSHLDMVRPGIASYGLYPSDEVNKKKVGLKPAMALKTRIIQLKKVPAGFKISYGATYETQKPTTIATVPVGYADGLNRLLSSNGQMLVGGQRVPIVGRICMDLTMLDVGRIDHAQIGDEVVIFGQQGSESLTVDEMASSLNTINYEIVTGITARVPRIYLK